MMKETLYVFGGANEEGRVMSDFYEYETQTQQWHNKSHNNGNYPKGRKQHVLVTDDIHNKLYMHGGEGEEGEITNELWEYDIEKDKWTNRTTEKAPYLAGHAGIIQQHTMYVIGGEESNDEGMTTTTTNHLYAYSILENTWTTIDIKDLPKRANATLAPYNSFLIYSGGENEEGEESTQTYLISIKYKIAIELIDLEPPPARIHATSFVFGSQFVVFGGLLKDEQLDSRIYTFDFYEDTWLSPMILDIQPRYGHTMNMMYHAENAVFKIFVFGGATSMNDDELCGDLIEFELHLSKSNLPCPTPPILNYMSLAIKDLSNLSSSTTLSQDEKHSDTSLAIKDPSNSSTTTSQDEKHSDSTLKKKKTKKESKIKSKKKLTSKEKSTIKEKSTSKEKSTTRKEKSKQTKEKIPKTRDDIKPTHPSQKGNQRNSQLCGIS